MSKKILYNSDDILEILPHRPPFLFVDYITKFIIDKRIETERLLREDEPYFAGHFPSKPIMPGVLIVDALAQTSGLLWGFSKKNKNNKKDEIENTSDFFFLAATNIKFVNPAFPGETLCMTSYFNKKFGAFYTFDVDACVKHKSIAKGTLTLVMRKE